MIHPSLLEKSGRNGANSADNSTIRMLAGSKKNHLMLDWLTVLELQLIEPLAVLSAR
jgi:hypothetical protein